MSVLTQTLLWQELLRHRDDLKAVSLSTLVLNDPKRLETCTLALEGLRLTYALNQVTSETLHLLLRLAEQQKVEDWRRRMLCGEKINATENRAVLHTALRQKTGSTARVDGRDVSADIQVARQRMTTFVGDVREGRWQGFTGKKITHIVNLGIGGSDLGPMLVTDALAKEVSLPRAHFVANVDAFDLHSTLKTLDPETTLFVVVSKTFTTIETLMNAKMARTWIVDKLGVEAVTKHFVAVSADEAEVRKFGIPSQNLFPMWDWVGGRFSLWSSVGLSAALAIGMDNFNKMLAGAAAMDRHFETAPLLENLPVILALLGIWNINFLGIRALAVLPYSQRLRHLPHYLQQLEMESNGKTVTREGALVDYATAPIIFGEAGTVGQHSFHQWLHQGSDIVMADFIGVTEDDLGQPEHHQALLSNMTAQASALAFGQAEAASPQNVCPGNRPSNLILLDRLDPYHFGMLLALYEHKVFVQGVVWNINSFDQPGVELGKRIARSLASSKVPESSAEGFTAALFRKIGTLQGK